MLDIEVKIQTGSNADIDFNDAFNDERPLSVIVTEKMYAIDGKSHTYRLEIVEDKPEPQKQFKYEKVTFDRASSALMSWEEFHAGNEAYHLYIKTGDRFVEPDIYQVVGNYENLYRKTELDAVEELAKELHEIDWQEIKANGEWDDLSDEAVLSYKKMAKHAIDKLGAK